jgi:hypothetical protein
MAHAITQESLAIVSGWLSASLDAAHVRGA